MILALTGVSYNYPDGTPALRDVSLTVAPSERVALIGPNGAGKSTLLLQLNGLAGAHPGIVVDGLPLQRQTLKQIRQRVGLVFQNPDDQLFCPTVFDDVAFGPRNLGLDEDAVAERVHAALADVGMTGYDRRCAYHLSVGQKRRVALATVLAMRPALLALDEPSSNLDPCGRRLLIELLASLPQAQLIATHDLALVRALCGRAVLLAEGRKIAEGAPGELLADQALLEAHGLA